MTYSGFNFFKFLVDVTLQPLPAINPEHLDFPINKSIIQLNNERSFV